MFENALPCIVELFGHTRIAGLVSEQQVGGTSFVRVDVPAIDGEAAFTKLYGANAIYSIAPVDETTMLAAAQAFKAAPVERWRFTINDRLQLEAPDEGDEELNEDNYDDDDDFEDEISSLDDTIRPPREPRF